MSVSEMQKDTINQLIDAMQEIVSIIGKHGEMMRALHERIELLEKKGNK